MCMYSKRNFALLCVGDMVQVESLIKDGANVNENENTEYGFAPLHFSAAAGKL